MSAPPGYYHFFKQPENDEKPMRQNSHFTAAPQAGGMPLELSVDLPRLIRTNDYPRVVRTNDISYFEPGFFRDYSDTIGKITTLGRWKEFWNELYDPIPLWFVPLDGPAVYLSGSEQPLTELDNPSGSIDEAKLDISWIDVKKPDPAMIDKGHWRQFDKYDSEIDFTCAPSSQKDASFVAAWQGKTSEASGLGTTKFLFKMPLRPNEQRLYNWTSYVNGPEILRAGPFERAFPALSALPHHPYDTIQIKELKDLPKNQVDRSKEELEIFGVKVSKAIIATIGLPLLIALQLLFGSVAGTYYDTTERSRSRTPQVSGYCWKVSHFS
jgi:hypothetical protein